MQHSNRQTTTLEPVNRFILSIADKEQPPLHINITGGTNLMAGAACAAAFFVGAKAYYVLGRSATPIRESKVIELPVLNIPYYRVIQKSQLAILRSISELGGLTSNSALRAKSGLSAQKLSYHVRELEKKALIVTSRDFRQRTETSGLLQTKSDKRKLVIELTNAGRLFLSWSQT